MAQIMGGWHLISLIKSNAKDGLYRVTKGFWIYFLIFHNVDFHIHWEYLENLVKVCGTEWVVWW